MDVFLMLAMSVLAIAYIVGCAVKFRIPESASETYYLLGASGWIFQLVMFITGVCLLPVWLSLSKAEYQCFVFLACSSLCFVSLAPAFRLEIQGKVHYSAAAICCVSVFAWQMLEGLCDVMLWFVCIGGMLTLTNRSKWCWWLECAAIGSLFASLWIAC